MRSCSQKGAIARLKPTKKDEDLTYPPKNGIISKVVAMAMYLDRHANVN